MRPAQEGQEGVWPLSPTRFTCRGNPVTLCSRIVKKSPNIWIHITEKFVVKICLPLFSLLSQDDALFTCHERRGLLQWWCDIFNIIRFFQLSIIRVTGECWLFFPEILINNFFEHSGLIFCLGKTICGESYAETCGLYVGGSLALVAQNVFSLAVLPLLLTSRLLTRGRYYPNSRKTILRHKFRLFFYLGVRHRYCGGLKEDPHPGSPNAERLKFSQTKSQERDFKWELKELRFVPSGSEINCGGGG